MSNAPIIHDYPAYSIHEPQVAPLRGMPVIRSDENIMIYMDGKYGGLWHEFSPGSVVSYSLKYDDDPIEAVQRAKKLGHKLKWINKCAVSITSEKRAKQWFYGFELGDKVWFEGEAFTLELDWNRNVKLVPAD